MAISTASTFEKRRPRYFTALFVVMALTSLTTIGQDCGRLGISPAELGISESLHRGQFFTAPFPLFDRHPELIGCRGAGFAAETTAFFGTWAGCAGFAASSSPFYSSNGIQDDSFRLTSFIPMDVISDSRIRAPSIANSHNCNAIRASDSLVEIDNESRDIVTCDRNRIGVISDVGSHA